MTWGRKGASALFALAVMSCDRVGDKPPWWPNRARTEAVEVPWCALAKQAPHPAVDKSSAGHLPPDEIQRLVRRRYRALQSCYAAALARDGAAQGRVTTRFVIEPDGSVSHACISEATLQDHKALACMGEEFSSMRFPPANGVLTVVYPIQYQPASLPAESSKQKPQ